MSNDILDTLAEALARVSADSMIEGAKLQGASDAVIKLMEDGLRGKPFAESHEIHKHHWHAIARRAIDVLAERSLLVYYPIAASET